MSAVHPTAQQRLDILKADLPQAILLSGPRGVGLRTIAQEIAGRGLLADVRPRNTKDQADNEYGTISVEMIRQLYTQSRAKHTTRQVILIDDADRMSRGAQAAFLKLLEEPNQHIHFILTSHAPQHLVNTIRSRVQETVIAPISPEQTAAYLSTLQVSNPTKLAQLQFIAAGLPAELSRLAEDEAYFAARAEVMSDARTLLQGSSYAKLLIAQKYQGNRERAAQLLDSALMIARRSLSSKPQPGLVTQLEKLLAVQEAIAQNFNIRLQLARFVL